MKQWIEFESTMPDCETKGLKVFVNSEYASVRVSGSTIYADFFHDELRSICEQILNALDKYKDEE